VTLDSYEIKSHEAHLTQHWLPLSALKNYDIRPTIVRDAIAGRTWKNVKRLVVPFL
jgi:hypothetical protein